MSETTFQEVEEKNIDFIKCKSSGCAYESNMPINVLCNKCSRPLLKLNWLHFFIFLSSISFIGFIISYFKNTWIPSLYAEFLLILYFLLILRRESSARNLSIFLIFMTFPLAFLSIHGTFGIIYLDYSYILLGIIAVVYLFSCYFITWRKACFENDTTLIKGFSVISFTLFLLVLLTDFSINSLGLDIFEKEILVFNKQFSIAKIISFLKTNIKIREILLVITIIQIMFLALVNTVKNRIPRSNNLFDPETRISPIDLMHKNVLLNAIFKIAQTIVNVSAHFYKITTEIIKTIINTIKIIIEYILKFIRNYAYEILKFIRSFIIIFLKTNFYFFKDYFIQLVIFVLIALQSNYLVNDISQYINAGTMANYSHFFLNILTIFIEIIILIWLLTGYKFATTLDSVSVTNVWFTFVLLVSVLISSWFLWVLSQFIGNLAFKQVGNFTKYGSIILLFSILILFFVTYFIQKKKA